MAKNSLKVDIAMDASKLIDGAKKSQQAIKDVGAEVKKTDSNFKSIKSEINQNQKDLNKLTNEYRILKQRLGENAAATQDAKAKMDAKVATVARLRAEEQKVANQVKIATQNIMNQGNAAQQASAKINTMSGSMSRLSKLGSMSSSLGMLGSMVGIPTGALSSVSMMTSSLGSLSGSAAGAGAAMGGLSAATLGVGAAVVAAGAIFYKTAKSTYEFDKSLNTLRADLNISEEATKKYGDAALDLSNKYGKSANEIIKGFQAIADSSPGLEKDEEAMIAVADASNKLAIALGTDLESSTKVVTTAMSKFNIEAKDVQKTINQIAEITRNSGANMEYIQTVFDKAGSAAQQAGIEMGSIGSATSVLSTKFNDASQVGTGLSMMIKRLTTQSNSEFNPAIVGMDKALQNLANANLSAADAQKLFGNRGRDVAMTLISMNDQFQETEEKMKNTAAAEEMFGVKSAELGFVVNQIKSLWSNFLIKLGESEGFKAVMGVISTLITWIRDLSQEIQNAFNGDMFSGFKDMWNGIKQALEAVLPYITQLIVFWMKFYQMIQSTISEILSIVWDLVTEIGTAIAEAFGFEDISYEDFIEGVKNGFNFILELAGKIKDGFVEAWTTIKTVVMSVLQPVISMFGALWDILTSVWNMITTIGGAILEAFGFDFSGTSDGLSTIYDWFTKIQEGIQTVINWFSELTRVVSQAISDIGDIISGLITMLTKWFSELWESIKSGLNSVKQWFSNIWNGIKSIVSKVVNWIKNAWNSFYNAVADTWAFQAIVDAINWIIDAFNWVKNKVTGVWNSFMNWIAKLWNGFLDTVKDGVDILNQIPGVNINLGNYKIKVTSSGSSGGDAAKFGGTRPTAKKPTSNTPTSTDTPTSEDTPTTPHGGGGGHKGGSGSGGRKGSSSKPTKKSEEEKKEETLIQQYQKKIQEINKKLENNPSEKETSRLLKERLDYENKIKDIQDAQKKRAAEIWWNEVKENATLEDKKKRVKDIDLLTTGLLPTDEKRIKLEQEQVQLSNDIKQEEARRKRELDEANLKYKEGIERKKAELDIVNNQLESDANNNQLLEEKARLEREIAEAQEQQKDLLEEINWLQIKDNATIAEKEKRIQRNNNLIKSGELSDDERAERQAENRTLQKDVDDYNKKLKREEKLAAGYTEEDLDFDDALEQLDKVEAKFSRLQTLYDAGLIDKDRFKSETEGLQEIIDGLGLKVKLKPEIEQANWQKQMDHAADALNQVGDNIKSIGEVAGSQAFNIAGTIAQAIANIWLGYSEASAQSASLGPWAWVGFSLAALGQAIGVISAIKSNQYAQGGIVTGNSTVGDKLYARLNGGEMVLNNRQQQHLMNIVNGAPTDGQATHLTTAEVKIRGNDLYAVLNNTAKTKSLVGKNIGIR